MTTLVEKMSADVGPVDTKPPRKTNGSRVHGEQSIYDQCKAVDIRAVYAWQNLEYTEKACQCPHCRRMDGTACAFIGNVAKCLTDTCSTQGPPGFPGVYTTIDVVMEVQGCTAAEAVELIAERFNIPMPERKAASNDTTWADGSPVEPSQERERQQFGKLATKKPRTVADIVSDWRDEGQSERVDIGISSFDQLCGGGLPIPRRVLVTGAPSAGKTYEMVWIAEQFLTRLADFGFFVGIVAIDEDDTDLLVRFAQMRGFTPEQLEARSEETLAAVLVEFADAPIRFYDGEWSLDAAVEDLAAAAKAQECRSALFVDSIHVAWSVAGISAKSPRESIDCNFKVLKRAHLVHRMTVVTTGEMNRQNYASEKQAADANILASTAETRAAEFWAQTHIAVRTPKDLDGIVECTVAKNRGIRSKKGKFWLRLQHETHDLIEVGDPNENPEFVQAKENRKIDGRNRKNAVDATQLAQFILAHPGLNVRGLRTAVSADPLLGWGHTKLDKALAVLRSGQTIYSITEPKRDGPAVYGITLEPGGYDA